MKFAVVFLLCIVAFSSGVVGWVSLYLASEVGTASLAIVYLGKAIGCLLIFGAIVAGAEMAMVIWIGIQSRKIP
jgi:hypothetical protein